MNAIGKMNGFSVPKQPVVNPQPTPVVRPIRPQAPQGLNVIQPNQAPNAGVNPSAQPKTLPGIRPTGDLSSNVKEKTIKIPDFLK